MNAEHDDGGEDEYVLLDLGGVSGKVDLAPGTPYVLSGLDTMNPVLTIGDKLKLIGEYEETVGTCLIFSENERKPVVHEETGASEENLFKGVGIVDPNQSPGKELKPVTSLHKVLKFRLMFGSACKPLIRLVLVVKGVNEKRRSKLSSALVFFRVLAEGENDGVD
ncbi:hypothetical protein V2J09_007692 [Rumex salicifolius]